MYAYLISLVHLENFFSGFCRYNLSLEFKCVLSNNRQRLQHHLPRTDGERRPLYRTLSQTRGPLRQRLYCFRLLFLSPLPPFPPYHSLSALQRPFARPALCLVRGNG